MDLVRAQSGKVMVGHMLAMGLEELGFPIMAVEVTEPLEAGLQRVQLMEQVISGRNFI
jgi:hypothetical protein